MDAERKITPTPWDERALGMPTFEVLSYDRETLGMALQTPGHYTIKVDPLTSKALLHEHGFYYCDTLLEAHCPSGHFIDHPHEHASISRDIDMPHALRIAMEAFSHGRFHRDFNLPVERANKRYALWLEDLQREGQVYGLMFEGRQAGFMACKGAHLALHAIDIQHRGQGIAKYLWSAACRELFSQGHGELSSSVSAGNVTVVNLYAGLGFRFRSPRDIYHLLVE